MPSSSVKSLEAEGYTISQFDVQPARFEARPKLFLFSTLAYWSLYSLYFIVHVFVIRSLHWHSSGLHWQLWVLLYTEICLTLQDAILAFNLVQGLLCAADLIPRSRYELNGSRAPTVDVFVPCCGEPVDVILDTVHAVLNQDYPTNRFRVLVLDDGRSEELEDAIQKLNVSINNYTSSRALYLSRTLAHGERSYFKAGNLQYGITESRAKPLDGANEPGGSQFIASLDADMIPHPAWLRCLVPHLLCDRTAAMIAPPQQYYNVPPSDPFGNAAEFARWFDLFEPLNDHLGAAMCTGTGFVLRREAVERIGGWPLVETGEDFLCGCLLSDAGWKVLYTNEALQCGLAPASLKAHVAQRMRWVDSGIEVHKRFGFYLPGSRLSQGMTLGQRLVALTMMLREYAPLLIVPALLLLPLAVFPGPDDELILLTGARESTWLGWLFAAAWLTGKVNCAILYTGMDAQGIANFQANDIWCSPYLAARCLYSFLPRSLAVMHFEVSGAMLSTLDERSRTRRASLARRLLRVDMLLYLSYVLYALVPVLLRLRVATSCSIHSWNFCTAMLLPGPLIKIVRAIWYASVPLRYMARPPAMPERRHLMARDEKECWRPDGRRGAESTDRIWTWMDIFEALVICITLTG